LTQEHTGGTLHTVTTRAAYSINETGALLGLSWFVVKGLIDSGRLHTVPVTDHKSVVPAWSIAQLLGSDELHVAHEFDAALGSVPVDVDPPGTARPATGIDPSATRIVRRRRP
jgi:hypothetical protein